MTENNLPRHIAIIPDGNRRYAKARGKSPWEGHRFGSKTFKNLVQWCKEFDIKELSFWACSTDNLMRDKTEVKFLLSLIEEFADEQIRDIEAGKRKDVKMRFIGDLGKLPESIVKKFKKIESLTEKNEGHIFNGIVAYGGEWELTEAAKELAREVKQGKLDPEKITPELFEKHLKLQSKPDLIIRTSQQRLSGLLPWQSAYSEIIFIEKKHWPEFSKNDFKACLDEYARRIRTFGK